LKELKKGMRPMIAAIIGRIPFSLIPLFQLESAGTGDTIIDTMLEADIA
jgi:hypothetical protein